MPRLSMIFGTIAALTLIACEPANPDENELGAIDQCIADFAVEDGYDHEVDDGTWTCPQPIDEEPVECDPPSPDSLADEAHEDGHAFDPGQVVSREAAECIAEHEGFDLALDDLTFGLVYHNEEHRPSWIVHRTLQQESDTVASGDGIHIDAVTGEVLDEFDWNVTSG